MFVGILIGLVLGGLLGGFVGFHYAESMMFLGSSAVGLGIGVAFIATGALINALVKFMDRQSQKVKSG
jgi:hypothetical protein